MSTTLTPDTDRIERSRAAQAQATAEGFTPDTLRHALRSAEIYQAADRAEAHQVAGTSRRENIHGTVSGYFIACTCGHESFGGLKRLAVARHAHHVETAR